MVNIYSPQTNSSIFENQFFKLQPSTTTFNHNHNLQPQHSTTTFNHNLQPQTSTINFCQQLHLFLSSLPIITFTLFYQDPGFHLPILALISILLLTLTLQRICAFHFLLKLHPILGSRFFLKVAHLQIWSR